MAPMAFMLARVGRNASARSLSAVPDAATVLPAAAAASRAARSGNASGDHFLNSRSVASKRQFLGSVNHTGGRPLSTDSSHGVNSVSGHSDHCQYDTPGILKVDEKDLVSDEALWSLYHRWCKYFKVERSHEEMIHRFDRFKTVARKAREPNDCYDCFRMGINSLADRSPSEFTCKLPLVPNEHYLYAKAVGGYTITFGLDED